MSAERIKRILDSGHKAVLVTTGGGSTALNALLTTPGASRFVSDAQIPYSPDALERFLGEEVEQSCSPKTAVALARAAFKFQVSGFKFLSVSCTAALPTNRKRRGEDRAFICIKTGQTETLYSLHFSRTSREEQEVFLSEWLLVLIARAVGAERGLMLPGSFHPVHQGHINLLQAAEDLTGLHGVFELSCANVDKPDIPEHEILRRASAIKDIPVALTQAPRFTQKAELFPRTTFVLGYDTAERLIAPHYSKARKNQWEFFQTLETSFLVAGRFFQTLEPTSSDFSTSRSKGSPLFQTLENLELPDGFEGLFKPIPEDKFREDISSTELRSS